MIVNIGKYKGLHIEDHPNECLEDLVYDGRRATRYGRRHFPRTIELGFRAEDELRYRKKKGIVIPKKHADMKLALLKESKRNNSKKPLSSLYRDIPF